MQPVERQTQERERRARIPISAVTCFRYANDAANEAVHDEALQALAISIRHLGLLQPIMVRVTGLYRYELVSGRRRLEACRQLGHTHIEAFLLSMAKTREEILSLVDNLRREGLHYLEEAEGYASALSSGHTTREELSRHVERSQSHISRKLSLLRLDESVRETLFHARLSERHARLLLRLPDARRQREAIAQMVEMRMDVSESEALIAAIGGACGLIEEADKSRGPRQIKSFIRDQRLYVNAISDIIRQMTDAGMPAEMEISEGEDGVVIQVRMRKISG